MKVACVTKNFDINAMGGLVASSYSFHKWANIFGLEADQVGFTASGRVLKDWHFTNSDQLLKVHNSKLYYDVLNSYDAIYFTCVAIRYSKKGAPDPFLLDNITTPFVIGVHDEDFNVDFIEYLDQAANHKYFKGFLTVTPHTVDFLPTEAPQYYWHPCTLPEYLVGHPDSPTSWNPNSKGLSYFGRLYGWRQLPTLAKLTLDNSFMSEVQNTVELMGRFSGIGGYTLKSRLNSINPNWKIIEDSSISVFDINQLKARHSSFRYFWDVGNPKPDVHYLKRFNLVAIEAMSQGCIPIVSPQFAPEWTYPFSVLFDKDELESGRFIDKLRRVNENLELYRSNMKETLINSDWSYYNVKSRMKKVFDDLL